MENETRWEEQTHLVPVWDLPTRLFHWLLVVLVAAAAEAAVGLALIISAYRKRKTVIADELNLMKG